MTTAAQRLTRDPTATSPRPIYYPATPLTSSANGPYRSRRQADPALPAADDSALWPDSPVDLGVRLGVTSGVADPKQPQMGPLHV